MNLHPESKVEPATASPSKGVPAAEKNQQTILHILAYSDIFQYPLTKEEIYERGQLAPKDLEKNLADLLSENKIFKLGNFYSLRDSTDVVDKRIRRNKKADQYRKIARFITRIIIHFPFIRAVFLSGSISKNCIDKNSDIDYFIITEPNRLWIVHFFCSLFRRIALLNNSKFFCCNYLIDTEHLLITEQSIYTAMEIKSLVPLFGYSYYDAMQKENKWTDTYFPNYMNQLDSDLTKSQPFIQKGLEYLFNNKLGDWLDNQLLNYCLKKRRRKFASLLFDQPQYYINLQKHVAKSHLSDNYPKIMQEYLVKVEQYKI